MINRMVVRNLEKEILKLLRQSKTPISTTDISSNLNISWHSVQIRCLKLQMQNKINGFRIGKMNLWEIK